MNPELLEKILSNRSLPTLPQVALEVVRLCAREDVSLDAIGALVARDPALSSRIVRMANSAVLGIPRGVRNIPQAVSRLGLQRVRVVTLTSSLVDGFSSRRLAGFDNERFWRDALTTALAAKAWTPRARFPDPDEAFLAGLVQDLGVFGLAAALGKDYSALLAEANASGVEIATLEEERLGISHAEVSAGLLAAWSFPEPLVAAVRRHVRGPEETPPGNDVDRISAALFLAERVRRAFRAPTPAVVGDLAAVARRLLAVEKEEVSTILGEVQRSLRETAATMLVEVGSEEEIETARREAQELLVQLSVANLERAARFERERDSAREEARIDPLTGALRRGPLDEALSEALGARRAAALLLFDIDFFKHVNDRHGHPAGDEVLRATARTISRALPEGTTIGRYGGEEFLAILRDVSLEEAVEAAEDVRRSVERGSVETGGSTVRVTVSGGLCWVAPGVGLDPASAFRAADAALYDAKRSGRNRIRCATSTAARDRSPSPKS